MYSNIEQKEEYKTSSNKDKQKFIKKCTHDIRNYRPLNRETLILMNRLDYHLKTV